MFWFTLYVFFIFCISTHGFPILGVKTSSPKTKTYTRDDVLKRLLKQSEGISKAQKSIEPSKTNLQTKSVFNPTRLYDKAKVTIGNQKTSTHLKNEEELIKITHGGKAKVSKDLFLRKKYTAISANRPSTSDLEYAIGGPKTK